MGKTKKKRLSDCALIHEVRSHLLYELDWLIFSADAFRRPNNDAYVSFLDSAAIHARNLFEFAAKKDVSRFTLHALGGRTARSNDWDRWVNNRVAHMIERERDKAPWPKDGGSYESPDKLMVMAKVVLDRLRDGWEAMPCQQVREAYNEVLTAAERYWDKPNPQNRLLLSQLRDTSQHEPYPSEN